MTRRRSRETAAIDYANDLAISAVPYDAALVAELCTNVDPRLRAPAVWPGRARVDEGDAGAEVVSPLSADQSRIAVILHQRLWGHDVITRGDDVKLRLRLEQRSGSIRVVTLDSEPLPSWLKKAPRRDLSADGVLGVSDFLIDAITDAGGSVNGPLMPQSPPEHSDRRWPEGPRPFLTQPRAFSMLRRELDLLAAELKAKSQSRQSAPTDRAAEFQALPNRLVLRLEDVGVSFSWVAGRQGTVEDGRLLVMQWEGAAPRLRGASAMSFSTAVRESVYRVESDGPERWSWRMDCPNGRACSTQHLAAEWIAGTSVSAGETAGAPLASEFAK